MSLNTVTGDDDRKTVVVGSDAVSVLTARRLPGPVQFLSPCEQTVRRVDADVEQASVIEDPQRLSGVDDSVETAVVATPQDGRNLLYAQSLSVGHGVSDVVVRLTDPDYREAFSTVDADLVCTATNVSESLVERYARLVV